MKTASVLAFLLSAASVQAGAQTVPAPAMASAKPTPPTRPADGPGAPHWTIVAAGMNPPAERNGDFEIGPDYRPPPEADAVKGRARGTVRQFMMDSKESKLYPGIGRDAFGTVDPDNPRTLIVKTHAEPWRRAITVYIPAHYKRGTKAPLIVVNDGPKLGDEDMLLTRVLDNLIDEHRVPAMIAVMIQNGGGDAQGSERGLEYDTLSGRFAEFVEHEVLPRVQSHYHVELTHDPNGRAVMGCSSGAAAAFTMAWFHPEWYHRVISYSGTFVNQQWPFSAADPGGAWDYHETIIRDAKRKPIRIWMEVGDRDLLNPNIMRDGMHDWVAANHRMAAVFKEKGYAYQYVFALDAGHCEPKVREQTLSEALQWVWRGYEPVR